MKIETFQPGTYRQQFRYRSVAPVEINGPWTWDSPEIHQLLAEANWHLGELNGLSLIVPDVDRFIQIHVVKEAQTSSRIEGTQTEMDEALQDDPDEIDPEKRDDWQEVRNYVAAMNEALTSLERLPLSNRLLCEAHATLLKGVRGEGKTPGEFRRSQNWIGGATLADAVFIPPRHEDVPHLMGDLEAYLRPVTTSGSLAKSLDLSQATSDRILADLQQLGIVAEMTGQRRNRVFIFREYYQLFLT